MWLRDISVGSSEAAPVLSSYQSWFSNRFKSNGFNRPFRWSFGVSMGWLGSSQFTEVLPTMNSTTMKYDSNNNFQNFPRLWIQKSWDDSEFMVFPCISNIFQQFKFYSNLTVDPGLTLCWWPAAGSSVPRRSGADRSSEHQLGGWTWHFNIKASCFFFPKCNCNVFLTKNHASKLNNMCF